METAPIGPQTAQAVLANVAAILIAWQYYWLAGTGTQTACAVLANAAAILIARPKF